jgi:hypothetical protein
MVSMIVSRMGIAKLVLVAAMLLPSLLLQSQVSRGGTPKSFELNLPADIPAVTTPGIDLARLQAEDAVNDLQNVPYRFAESFMVAYNLHNAGVWHELPNGDRIWQFKITCPGAHSVNLLYDNFYMPEGAFYYIYNEDRSQILGAFGAHNNKVHGAFATALVFDETIILDYYEPAAVKGQGRIDIAQINHGYRPVIYFENGEGLNDAGNCQVNVNCSPEGDNWQTAKKAVGLITLNGSALCTGALVNNTAQDCTPYFLTADHCIDPTYDAITNPNIGGMVFYWNFERAGCANTGSVPTETTAVATLVANPSSSSASQTSDFALMEISANPADDYDVYFAGWDASGNQGNTGVGIHHPAGDAKKIATHDIVPTSVVGNRYWRIYWSQTPNGWSVTEGGSSGSPLFNQDQRIIGQLFGGFLGGQPNCNDPANDEGDYGKLSYSWENAGATDVRRRLNEWLDPVGSGATTVLSGSSDPCGSSTCVLNNAGLANVSCNDNGTPFDTSDDFYTFTLNPSGIDTGNSYVVSGGGVSPTTGNYGGPTSFATAAGTVGSGNIILNISDSTNGNCSISATIFDVGDCSSSQPCDLQDAGLINIICDDNGTSTPNDDTYTFQLNPTGTGLGDFYFVDASRVGPSQASYGVTTTFSTGFGSANNGNDLVVTITDGDNPDCELVIIVPNPGPCSDEPDPVCDLNTAGLSTIACNDNGTDTDASDDFITFTLNPNGDNLGSGYQVTGNGFPTTTSSYGGPTGFAAPAGSAGNGNLILTITDLDDPNCTITVSVSDPGSCSTAVPCDLQSAGLSGVSCDDNGTPSDDTDDAISFSINPSGVSLGGTYTLDGPGVGTVTGNLYGLPLSFTTFPGTAGNGPLTLTISDEQNPGCSFTFTVNDPGTCSDDNGGGGGSDCGLDQVSCQDVTINIGSNGIVVFNPNSALVIADPDCSYSAFQIAPRSNIFRCFQVGTTTNVTIRIVADDGSSTTCTTAVTVADLNGNCDESGSSGESLGNAMAQQTLEVFPNPASNQLYVRVPTLEKESGRLYLFDALGQLVHQQMVPANTLHTIELQTADLPQGIYLLSFQANGHQQQQRVVISR